MKGHNRWDAILGRLPTDIPLVGVEVGVWAGRLSEQLLRSRPLLKLNMVDRWTPPREGDSYLTSGAEMALRPQAAYDAALREARNRVAFFGRRGWIIVSDSVSTVRGFAAVGTRFDFVFVDADHSYEGVTRDLRAWLPLVKPGGWIGGHDYDHPHQGEVKRAVHDFLGPGAEIEVDVGRTWFFRVPG